MVCKGQTRSRKQSSCTRLFRRRARKACHQKGASRWECRGRPAARGEQITWCPPPLPRDCTVTRIGSQVARAMRNAKATRGGMRGKSKNFQPKCAKRGAQSPKVACINKPEAPQTKRNQNTTQAQELPNHTRKQAKQQRNRKDNAQAENLQRKIIKPQTQQRRRTHKQG